MCQDRETMGYTLLTDNVPGHLSSLCWNHLFASFGQWPGIWQIQAPGPARPFSCFVILADLPHQLRKAFSLGLVSPLVFGDSQMATGRNGFGRLWNALQISPNYAFWAPTMCWGFGPRILENSWRDVTDIHVIQDGPLDTWPKAVVHDKHPQSRVGRLPEGGASHAWSWGYIT